MTTHMNGTDVMATLLHLGLTCTDVDPDDPSFESPNQSAVSRAHAALLDTGYVFTDSFSEPGGVFETIFASASESPAFVRVSYVHRRRTSLYFALCYVDHGRFVQYAKPYRTFVTDLNGPEAEQMERDFITDMSADGMDVRFYWMPILIGSPLVHF